MSDFRRNWGCWLMYLVCGSAAAVYLFNGSYPALFWVCMCMLWAGVSHQTNRDFHELFRVAQHGLNKADERVANAETDADYYRLIVLGKWPDADEVIAAARKLEASKISRPTAIP